MRIRSPFTLLEYCMGPLVILTITALQNLCPKSELNDPNTTDEKYSVTPVKRKLKNDSPVPSTGHFSRKRMKRESTPYPDVDDDKAKLDDDTTVDKYSVVDDVIILRNYFDCLPENLWNKFFCLAIKALNALNLPSANRKVEVRAFEFLFCKKVSSFSTRMVDFHVYDKCENLLLERLRLCRNMRSLEIHYRIKLTFEETFLSSLSRLSHIRTAIFLPDSKQSLHSVIPIIAQNCRLLEELTVSYASEFMSSNKNNIRCLKNCTKLTKLLLHSYGRGSEVEHILILLYQLKGLKHFFHRDLPHAITDIFSRRFRKSSKITLNLKSLFLSAYSRCVGSQLCYLPDESLLQIANVCPFLEYVKLVKPSSLSHAVQSMPFLSRLHIHDCNIKESFVQCSGRGYLNKLSSLCLINTEHIDFGDILLLSNSCPQLQEFEITNSNLFWSNDLSQTSCLFPHLRKLKILKNPSGEQTEPRFIFPHKLHLDKTITRLLLTGYGTLENLYLEFDHEAVRCTNPNSLPSKEELIAWIGRCKNLKELMLLSCPDVGYHMINTLVDSCPNLKQLLDINLWGIPSEDMDTVLRKYSYMFIQSHTRAYM